MKTPRYIFTVLVFSWCATVGCAAESNDESSVVRLRATSIFAFGGVGFAGITSEGENAMRELWKKEKASQVFLGVFDNATAEGKCYALVALRQLAPDLFKKCAETLRKNPPDRVNTMHGCLMGTSSTLRILDQIEAGEYAVFLPKKPNQASEPTAPSGRGSP